MVAGERGVFQAIERRGWGLVLGCTVLSVFLFSPRVTLGLLFGGSLGLLNFHLLKVYFTRVLKGGRPRAWLLHVAYAAKFVAIAGLLVLALAQGGLHPLGISAGIFLTIVAIVWGALMPAKGRLGVGQT